MYAAYIVSFSASFTNNHFRNMTYIVIKNVKNNRHHRRRIKKAYIDYIYRLSAQGQSKANDLNNFLMLHNISTAFKSLLRPSEMNSHEKSPADSLSSKYHVFIKYKGTLMFDTFLGYLKIVLCIALLVLSMYDKYGFWEEAIQNRKYYKQIF